MQIRINSFHVHLMNNPTAMHRVYLCTRPLNSRDLQFAANMASDFHVRSNLIRPFCHFKMVPLQVKPLKLSSLPKSEKRRGVSIKKINVWFRSRERRTTKETRLLNMNTARDLPTSGFLHADSFQRAGKVGRQGRQVEMHRVSRTLKCSNKTLPGE